MRDAQTEYESCVDVYQLRIKALNKVGLVWPGLAWPGLAWSGLVLSGLAWSGHENIIYTGINAQNLYILAKMLMSRM